MVAIQDTFWRRPRMPALVCISHKRKKPSRLADQRNRGLLTFHWARERCQGLVGRRLTREPSISARAEDLGFTSLPSLPSLVTAERKTLEIELATAIDAQSTRDTLPFGMPWFLIVDTMQ